MLQNRLATAGGSDERQRQRVLQFKQSIRQADEAASDLSMQIESLGEIPPNELKDHSVMKKAWKSERDLKDAATTELEKLKAEIERQANAVQSDINTALQKRERLQQRQTTLNEKHERLLTANREGFSAKQRKEQERAAVRSERASIEHQYRSNINSYERRANELNAATGSTLAAIQHIETMIMQHAQQQSVPTTPEGPLPGTANGFSPQANGFTPQSQAFSSFTFPSLTAHVDSTPNSLRGGRGRSSSMLSNVSGFTDGFDDAPSPSAIHMNPHLYGVLHGPYIGNGSNGSGGSLSSGTSSRSSSQRDPMSPVPQAKKPPVMRSATAGSGGR